MNFETYTRIGLVLAGVLLIFLINFDITSLLSRLLFWKSKNTTSEKEFLTMVNLWYKLKDICDKNNFDDASNKLDEVFPLLNNRNTDE